MTDDLVTITSPMQGTVVSIDVAVGETVRAGQAVAILESMKMEHPIEATAAGSVTEIEVAPGETVQAGGVLVRPAPAVGAVASARVVEAAVDLSAVRADLGAVLERHEIGTDARRPDAVERRRKIGHRTARENVDD